jgi:hypothetical protein
LQPVGSIFHNKKNETTARCRLPPARPSKNQNYQNKLVPRANTSICCGPSSSSSFSGGASASSSSTSTASVTTKTQTASQKQHTAPQPRLTRHSPSRSAVRNCKRGAAASRRPLIPHSGIFGKQRQETSTNPAPGCSTCEQRLGSSTLRFPQLLSAASSLRFGFRSGATLARRNEDSQPHNISPSPQFPAPSPRPPPPPPPLTTITAPSTPRAGP